MIGLKAKAEIYRLGLIIGLFCKQDILEWVDNTIEINSNVDYALIEISLNSRKSAEDIAYLLRDVEGEFDSKTVINIIIGLIAIKFNENNELGSETANMLYKLAHNVDSGVLENEVDSKINDLNNGFFLAEQNIYGYVKDMLSELNSFLKNYTKYSELFCC